MPMLLRMNRNQECLEEEFGEIPSSGIRQDSFDDSLYLEFWTRMLFSMLIDADVPGTPKSSMDGVKETSANRSLRNATSSRF